MRTLLVLSMVVMLAPAARAQTGKHLALGAGLNLHHYADGDFGSKNPGVDFVYRIVRNPGKGDGWNWETKTSVSWSKTDTRTDIGGSSTQLGRLQTIPIMVGVQRAYHQGPMKVGTWVVAGPSFNRFDTDGAARSAYASLGSELNSVDVNNSIAVRPGLSAWYDLGSWIGLHGSASYTFNRPTAKTTVDGVTTSSTLNTDHASFDLGLAIGIF
jgi:hypothetical protein